MPTITETFVTTRDNTTATSHTITPVTITSGKLAIVRFGVGSETVTVSSIADTPGNTWNTAVYRVGTGDGFSLGIAYSVLTNSLSAQTITFNLSATSTFNCDLATFTSSTGWLPQASVLDRTASSLVNNQAAWSSTKTAMTQNLNDLLVGCCCRINVNGSTSTPGAGWIEESDRITTNFNGSGDFVSQWKAVSARDTYDCTGTWGAAEFWVAAIAAFTPVADAAVEDGIYVNDPTETILPESPFWWG